MAKKKSRRPLPASQAKVSAKIEKVHHDDPELTHKQAVGKALGILRHDKKKKRRKKHR